jgi:hypothetical protein
LIFYTDSGSSSLCGLAKKKRPKNLVHRFNSEVCKLMRGCFRALTLCDISLDSPTSNRSGCHNGTNAVVRGGEKHPSNASTEERCGMMLLVPTSNKSETIAFAATTQEREGRHLKFDKGGYMKTFARRHAQMKKDKLRQSH